ncbi:MAG: formylglycine-generating enzyme family protein [Acidobacteria bacterium]|nr:formylglycine-generating enzyme family protein [Acidobacteriota bacterium]
MADELLPRFVRVPAGEFTMGADDGDEDERPAHRVFVDAFHLAIHPITNDQYADFVRQRPHPVPALRELPRVVTPAQEPAFRELAGAYAWRGGKMPKERGRHPVTLVAYTDAAMYCRWLGEQIGQPVRLATEAEWERAARGGVDGRHYPWGDDIDPSRANFLPEPALKRHRGTRPVGSYPSNAFDLSDMVGNVWEWVADWYRPDAYRNGDQRNPRGPSIGRLRLVRGGSWVTHDVRQLRCAHRHEVPVDTYAYSIGFRVAYSDDRKA